MTVRDPDEAPEPFELEIRSPHFALTPALRTYATRHLAYKLQKHGRYLEAVIVRFDDVNGTRGGIDKVCRVEVVTRVAGEPPLVVEEIEQDLRAAIDLAADRVALLLQSELDRRRDTPVQRGRRLVRFLKSLR
jgi:ribosome-associated translation inhibitor RaiA